MGEEPSRGSLKDQMGFTGVVWGAKWGRMDRLRQLLQEHWLLDGESFVLVFLLTPTAMMSGANPSHFCSCSSQLKWAELPSWHRRFSRLFQHFPSFSRALWLLGCSSTRTVGRGQCSPVASQQHWQEAVYTNIVMQRLLLLRKVKVMDITQKGWKPPLPPTESEHGGSGGGFLKMDLPVLRSSTELTHSHLPPRHLQSLNYPCSKNTA